MKKIAVIFFWGLVLAGVQCTRDESEGPRQEAELNCDENPSLCQLSQANNAFGFRIFQKLHEEDPSGNVFISPLSISTALAMTLNGANGPTRSDMQQTMELGAMKMPDINQAFKEYLEALPGLDPDVTMQPANSIWYRKGFSVQQEFLDTNTRYYNSQVEGLDFSNPAAKDVINDWVKDKTRGLIESIVDQIPSNVVMYLINAIYFKGAWKMEFDPENTLKNASFYPADGSSTTADMMMHGQIELPYFENGLFHAVDLAYSDSIYSMSVFLPKENVSIDAVISALSSENWNTWSNAFRADTIIFGMPKFKVEWEEDLNKVLIELGMGLAFSPGQADFTGINPQGGLWIDKVKHKSFVEVNEEGTEAAAVTSVVIVETSVPPYPFVVLNRPFLFVIRENQTNSVLFVGKMMNPRGE